MQWLKFSMLYCLLYIEFCCYFSTKLRLYLDIVTKNNENEAIKDLSVYIHTICEPG